MLLGVCAFLTTVSLGIAVTGFVASCASSPTAQTAEAVPQATVPAARFVVQTPSQYVEDGGGGWIAWQVTVMRDTATLRCYAVIRRGDEIAVLDHDIRCQ